MSRRTIIPADADPVEHAEARAELERAGLPYVEWRDRAAARVLLAFEPDDTRVAIGRINACTIALPHDSRVSRRHAELVRVDDGWDVVDGGSTNGTAVGSEVVVDRRRLRDGDRIVIGDTTLHYHAPGAPGSERARPAVGLTRQQRRVLAALCRPLLDGSTHRPAANSEIAAALMLSVERVKELLLELYERCGIDDVPAVQRRVRLARLAIEHGLVEPPQRDARTA